MTEDTPRYQAGAGSGLVPHGEATDRLVTYQALIDRVRALEETVEDLLAGRLALTATEPELRVRISHAHTMAGGWRCDGTTVEWIGRSRPDWTAIDLAMSASHATGRIEARERNAAEAAT